jgi:hypothetical protein
MQLACRKRDKQIIELRSRGVTLDAIGQRFGITRERVRQILNRNGIVRNFALQSDLMARFGVEWRELSQAIKAAGLSHEPGQRCWYALSDTDVAQIEQQLNRRRTRTCLICRGRFQGGRTSKRFCSPACPRALGVHCLLIRAGDSCFAGCRSPHLELSKRAFRERDQHEPP